MEITKEQKSKAERIISTMECPKGFMCYKSKFENLPNTKIVAEGKLIDCLEKNRQTCEFGLHFGSSIFCKCPLRNYIARNFHV